MVSKSSSKSISVIDTVYALHTYGAWDRKLEWAEQLLEILTTGLHGNLLAIPPKPNSCKMSKRRIYVIYIETQ